MRNLIFVILFTFVGSLSAQADGRPLKRVVITQDCGEKCKVYKNTQPHALAPPVDDMVCIRIQQASVGIVVIRFYNEAGTELDKGNEAHSNLKQPVDTFCVGRHYLIKAQSGRVEVCNDVKTKGLYAKEIATLLQSGMPPNAAVKLFASN